MSQDTRVQKNYYARTAQHYDSMHLQPADEHGKALSAFMGLAELMGPIESVLDVGAGTGRGVEKLKTRWPRARVMGVEPVAALREVGYAKGISRQELVDGDALNLPFANDSFDFVIETGVLHHIRTPLAAVTEMVRVAKKGVMISDCNNIGQGRSLAKLVKYGIKSMGLWSAFVFISTRGKMYKWSEGDGLFFSFTAFDCVKPVERKFPEVHYMNTTTVDGYNLYRSAPQLMIYACKPELPGAA